MANDRLAFVFAPNSGGGGEGVLSAILECLRYSDAIESYEVVDNRLTVVVKAPHGVSAQGWKQLQAARAPSFHVEIREVT